MKHRTGKTLALLLALVILVGLMPGMTAWAAWDGGTYTVSADETINNTIYVYNDATLTINSGVTLTINGSGNETGSAITIGSGKTLTVTGGGTLVVNGNSPGYGGGEHGIKDGTLSVVNATGGLNYPATERAAAIGSGGVVAAGILEESTDGTTYTVATGTSSTASYVRVTGVPAVTVTYQPNGGNGTMESDTVTVGSEFTLPGCEFVPPEGKTFKAWSYNGRECHVSDKLL